MILQHIFQSPTPDSPGQAPLNYRKMSRLLRDSGSPENLRVALMGNITLELVTPYFMVEAARIDQMVAFHVSPFGQHMQDLFSDRFRAFKPDVVVLVLAAENLWPDAFARFHLLSLEERHGLRDGIIAQVEDWVATALAQTEATLMVSNFPIRPSTLGIADLTSDYGETEFFLDLNLGMMRAVKALPRVQILDVAMAVSRVGISQAFDRRLHFMAKIEWTEATMREVGQAFCRNLIGIRGLARKCLVLDLDNSLWGGVLGEDGPHGILVGDGDMVSEAYQDFQRRVRGLKDRGILLAFCSKNNPEDVEEAFAVRTDMPLHASDFSARSVSWEPKNLGLEQIARTLNIGLDSLVFMDDNPAEIAMVRAYCPEVHCVLLPSDPADFVSVLDGLSCFEKARLTADDRRKSEQYAFVAERSGGGAIKDPMEYLHDLAMQAVIREATAADILRVQQLFSKTNQFNLTTRRLSMGEVEKMIEADDWTLVVAELRDRFGDLGTVALYAMRFDGQDMDIEHLLMSCRAMGRGLETALINDAKARFQAHARACLLRASYHPTVKNDPVSSLYETQHFRLVSADGAKYYTLDRGDVRFADCAWITLEKA